MYDNRLGITLAPTPYLTKTAVKEKRWRRKGRPDKVRKRYGEVPSEETYIVRNNGDAPGWPRGTTLVGHPETLKGVVKEMHPVIETEETGDDLLRMMQRAAKGT
ncbi:MAG: hypothetical protein GY906_39000 [bacterium]|nr:hypothetical protein [bacterium]